MVMPQNRLFIIFLLGLSRESKLVGKKMMNKQEALVRAKSLFGGHAYCKTVLVDGARLYKVGYLHDGVIRVKGVGTSWQEALKDAQDRMYKDKIIHSEQAKDEIKIKGVLHKFNSKPAVVIVISLCTIFLLVFLLSAPLNEDEKKLVGTWIPDNSNWELIFKSNRTYYIKHDMNHPDVGCYVQMTGEWSIKNGYLIRTLRHVFIMEPTILHPEPATRKETEETCHTSKILLLTERSITLPGVESGTTVTWRKKQ